MNRKNFKDILASFGPDNPRTPAQSREARLAKVVPPIVAEVLEQRRLLSLTISTTGGILSVTGDGTNQRIDVWRDGGDSIHIDENTVNQAIINPTLITNSLIKVFGLGGNDSIIAWGNSASAVQFPCQLYGDDGNDLVEGSDNADTIYGGLGYDTIEAWAGNDRVFGGTGSGSSEVSAGSDSIRGRDGNDTIWGEGGEDTLRGDVNADSILGGADNDSIDGGAGGDSLYGDAGDDYIDAGDLAGAAIDILVGGDGTDCGWWNEADDSDIDMEGNFN